MLGHYHINSNDSYYSSIVLTFEQHEQSIFYTMSKDQFINFHNIVQLVGLEEGFLIFNEKVTRPYPWSLFFYDPSIWIHKPK
jgi:hypothetical protein